MLGFIKTVLMFSSCNLNKTPLDLRTVGKTTKVNTEDSREAPRAQGRERKQATQVIERITT